jgi:regulator of protease activity HflC (stomatin/prohibitin superfamily)
VSLEFVLALGAALCLVMLGVRVVPESQRLAVMRLGTYLGLRGPGIVLLLPFIDKATRLTLDRDIPGWQSMSEEQLRAEAMRRLDQ